MDIALELPAHSRGAGNSMDMAFLIDRIEALVTNGRRLPLGKVLLDEQELLEIIDQMRVAMPNEINQARRVVQEREQIIGQAQAEADKIVTLARDKASMALSQDGLLIEAKTLSERMLSDSRKEAQTLKEEADSYAAEVLTKLESLLEAHLKQIRGGLAQLVPDGRPLSDLNPNR
jgi:cell division septum initiation protein DivIVA